MHTNIVTRTESTNECLGSNGYATFYRTENGLIFSVPNAAHSRLRATDLERWLQRSLRVLEQVCAAQSRMV
jgi:hypothetical protein